MSRSSDTGVVERSEGWESLMFQIDARYNPGLEARSTRFKEWMSA